MSFLRAAINLLTIISMLIIFERIMYFLAIEPSSYLIFLFWIIGLVLFYYLLPRSYQYFK